MLFRIRQGRDMRSQGFAENLDGENAGPGPVRPGGILLFLHTRNLQKSKGMQMNAVPCMLKAAIAACQQPL